MMGSYRLHLYGCLLLLTRSCCLQTFTALFQGRAAPHQIKHTWKLLQQVCKPALRSRCSCALSCAVKSGAVAKNTFWFSRLLGIQTCNTHGLDKKPTLLCTCSKHGLARNLLLSDCALMHTLLPPQQSESVVQEACAEFEVACSEVNLQQQLEELEGLILQRGLLGTGDRYAATCHD